MTIFFSNLGQNDNNSDGTLSVAIPIGGVPAGNTVVAFVTERGNSVPGGSVTDSKGNVYTAVGGLSLNNAQSSGFGNIFYCIGVTALAASDLVTYTKVLSGADVSISLIMLVNAGALNATVTASAGGTSTTPSVTSGVPSVGNMILGFIAGQGSSDVFTQPGGFLPVSESSSGLGNAAARTDGGYKVASAASAVTYAPTTGVSKAWAAFIIGFTDNGAAPTGQIIRNLSIVYSATGEPTQYLDIWRRDDVALPRPVLFFHGGGFTSGHKNAAEYDNLATAIAAAGYVWVSATYGLAPTYIQPVPIQHGFGAVRWLRANAAAYDINASDIVVAGASAGAILASMIYSTQGESTIIGTFGGNSSYSNDLCALLDLTGDVYDPDLYNLSAAGVAAMQATLGCADLNVCPNKTYLPQNHFTYSDKPVLIVKGEIDDELPIIHATNIKALLQSLNIPVTMIITPGVGHGMDGIDPQIAAIVAFLNQTFSALLGGSTISMMGA